MKVMAKTSFFYGNKLYKKNDILDIKDKDFNGINMVKVEEDVPAEEEDVRPTKTYTRKTTKKTSSKKSK